MKVKHKHLGIFTVLSEKFDSHFDKCMSPMATHFSDTSYKDLFVLQLNRFIGLTSNDELQVTSEDNVFDVIAYNINSNQLSPNEHTKLWSCCRFAFLSLKYLVKAQETIYNIPQYLLVEGLTFAKFKAEVSVDSPLWNMLEDYKKKSKTSNLFCERKPKSQGESFDHPLTSPDTFFFFWGLFHHHPPPSLFSNSSFLPFYVIHCHTHPPFIYSF